MADNTTQEVKSAVKTLTISQLGPQLPLGADVGGALVKGLATRPWRFKEERELGALREQHSEANMFQYVNMVLATMCPELGHHKFNEQQKLAERQVHIGQLYMPDVFYAYVWLRIQALGPLLAMKYACPHCRTKGTVNADLNTTMVKTVDNLADAQWTYELTTPLKIRGKELTKLKMGPPRWNALEMADTNMGMNTAAAKLLVIVGSIHAADELGGAVFIAADELDEMTKRDIEALASLIDANSVGPKMVLEHACTKCKAPMRLPIDWSYDSFFGISSP